jgi:hypothetical protein
MYHHITMIPSSRTATATQHDSQSTNQALSFLRQVASSFAICPWSACNRKAGALPLAKRKENHTRVDNYKRIRYFSEKSKVLQLHCP